MVVMFMHYRTTIVVKSFVMLVVMLRAVVLPVISLAVMSSLTSGRNVFSIVVALTIALVPIDFLVNIVFVHPLLIAIAASVFRQRRTRTRENEHNQYCQ